MHSWVRGPICLVRRLKKEDGLAAVEMGADRL
jgi:hypothetical protein